MWMVVIIIHYSILYLMSIWTRFDESVMRLLHLLIWNGILTKCIRLLEKVQYALKVICLADAAAVGSLFRLPIAHSLCTV